MADPFLSGSGICGERETVSAVDGGDANTLCEADAEICKQNVPYVILGLE